MAEPLDETYFKWLYGKVAAIRTRDPSRTYWVLFRQMFTKEFVWLIPNDDNRVQDGKDLRHEFLLETGLPQDDLWDSMGCSFLEMLIALARRFAFEADFTPQEWFWHMMRNIDLEDYNDFNYRTGNRVNPDNNYVNEVLDQVIWRKYAPDGRGGLFPLREPRQDQRTVELWYQMSAYILERE
jgi:hypothetical protein